MFIELCLHWNIHGILSLQDINQVLIGKVSSLRTKGELMKLQCPYAMPTPIQVFHCFTPINFSTSESQLRPIPNSFPFNCRTVQVYSQIHRASQACHQILVFASVFPQPAINQSKCYREHVTIATFCGSKCTKMCLNLTRC